MTNYCRLIAESEFFQTFILLLIIASALTLGLETVPEVYDQFYFIFDPFFYFCQVAFGFEILVRLQASSPRYREFFGDFWNRFDFVIVALSFTPAVGPFIIIARVLRLVRALRVISISDRLRNFADRIHESLDEAIGAAVIALVWSYIFSLSGYYLFSELDPLHWGSLTRAAKTLFYLLLLQDVASYVEPLLKVSVWSVFYFLLFYFVYLTLALGTLHAAIVQSLREARD